MRICFLLLTLPFISSLNAQNDTVIIYLDGIGKPAKEELAIHYAIQIKEKGYWKKVVYDIKDDKPLWGAHFSDSACTLHEGPYTTFNKGGAVLIKGKYMNNKKSGLWLKYADSGRLIDSSVFKDGVIRGLALQWYDDGSFRDSLKFDENGDGLSNASWPNGKQRETGEFRANKKNGSWIYYDKEGLKCQEVLYEKDSAIRFTCYLPNGQVMKKNCHYEKEATFTGGDKAWRQYLVRKMNSAKLPEAYLKGKIHGTLYVAFTVDIDGNLIDIKSLNNIDPSLEKIALSIIKEAPSWEPAIQYNRNVKAYRRQPITFLVLSGD